MAVAAILSTHLFNSVRRAEATSTGSWEIAAPLAPYNPVGVSGVTPAFDPNVFHLKPNSAVLADGRVMLFTAAIGGELYDPGTGTWTAVATFPGGLDPLCYPGTTCLPESGSLTALPSGDALYVGGMADSTTSSTRAWIFHPGPKSDPASGTWQEMPPMLTARSHHAAALLPNGTVLVAGGEVNVLGGTVRASQLAEVFDPTGSAGKGSWMPAGTMAQPRTDFTLTVLATKPNCVAPCGHVLAVGGVAQLTGYSWTPRSDGTVTELYDPSKKSTDLDQWTSAGTMAKARAGHTATLLDDGAVLVVGGLQGESIVERYDPWNGPAGTWTKSGETGGPAPLTTPRNKHSATKLLDGRVLVAGGYPGPSSPPTDSAELYDDSSRTWRPVASMPSPRYDHAALLLSKDCSTRCGNVLVSGGSYATSTWLFQPPDPSPPVVESLSPASGSPFGGTTVSIAGTGFDKVMGVWFGLTPASSYTVDSFQQITAVSPPAAEGQIDVTVANVAGISAKQPGDRFTYHQLSTRVDTVDPPVGPASGGTTVRVRGVGLSGATEVRFGPVTSTSIRVIDDDEVQALTPFNPQGEVPVVVTTPRGVSAAGPEFTYAAGAWRPAAVPQKPGFLHTATLLDPGFCHAEPRPPEHADYPCGDVLVAGGTTDIRPVGVEPSKSAALYDPGRDEWVAAAPMNVGRYYHTATLLADGRVLVAGGGDANGQGLSSAEIYNPESSGISGRGSWLVTGALHSGRFSHSATLLEGVSCTGQCGQVVAVGGTDSEAGRVALATVEIYDPELVQGALIGGWREVSALDSCRPASTSCVARQAHTATALPDGEVMVAGGSRVTAVRTECPTPVGGVNCAVYRETTASATAEVYDPTTDAWRPTGSMAVARFSHTASLLEGASCRQACGLVLAAGGILASNFPDAPPVFTQSAELYDPAGHETMDGHNVRGTWQPTGSMRVGRGGHTATTLADGTVLVAGKANTIAPTFGYAVGAAEVYDPLAGSWHLTGPMGHARGLHTATILEGPACRRALAPSYCGSVLVAGGSGPGNVVDNYNPNPPAEGTAEVYTPAPDVASVSAPQGPVAGGTSVTIAGSGFFEIASVSFGDTPAASFHVDSPTRITAVAPAHERGRVQVAVTNAVGTSAHQAPQAAALFSYLGDPSAVTDLVAAATSAHDVVLRFSAPGSDGDSPPPASRYVIKQSRSPIVDQASFDAATTLCEAERCGLVPPAVGTPLVVEVHDLDAAATYHYAIEAQSDVGVSGALSNDASVTTWDGASSRCGPAPVAGPGEIAYPGGHYSLVGGPSGTVLGSDSPLYSWSDAGAGGAYDTVAANAGTQAGRGYWAWWRCPHVVGFSGPGTSSVTMALGAYHASMVANPSAVSGASVTGQDFAATWDPDANANAGAYRVSAYRQPQSLAVGQGAWVFAFAATTVSIATP